MDPETNQPAAEPTVPQPADDPKPERGLEQGGEDPEEPSPAATPDLATRAPQPKPIKRLKRRKARTPPPAEDAAAKQASKSSISRRWLMIAVGAAVVVAVGGAAIVLARRHARPGHWTVGQEIPLEITVVAGDRTNLSCATTEDIGGKHCAFETSTSPWSKGPSTDDRSVLKPYTTTDRHNLLAAGLWSEPALGAALPGGRFSVKCTFVVEGTVKKLSVRWAPTGPWSDPLADWYAGTVKGCTLVPAPAAPAKS